MDHLVKISQSFPRFQTFPEIFEQFEKKNATVVFFHDFKYLMNFLSILKKKFFFLEIFQKYLPLKAPNFFWKNLKSLIFSILNIKKKNLKKSDRF